MNPAITTHSASSMRLLQLVSPSLPIGAFTYSQGLEWAVEAGWVSAHESLYDWLYDSLETSITYVEIPLFKRLYEAYARDDFKLAADWTDYLLASRETAELKLEEQQRGRAFTRLLPALDVKLSEEVKTNLIKTQLAGFAYVAVQWKIEMNSAIQAYVWGWLENLTLAGVKLIPLGQTAGQQIIFKLSDKISVAAEIGMSLKDEDIGFSCSAQAIASSLHETQYTRLYRS